MKVHFKEITYDEVGISYKRGAEPSDYTRGMDIPVQASDY
jgi:hypothetical protein